MDWLVYSWPTLILLGIALWMSLRVTYGVRGPEPGDPVYMLIVVTSWVLIALGVLPAVVGAVLGVHWIVLVVVFGVIAILAGATLVEAVVERRIAQRRSICRMLALLIEHGGQLESSVLMAGQSMRGIVGRAADRLFESLRRGTPIGAALNQNSAALPSEASAYLGAAATREGRLAALRELSRNDKGEASALWRASIDRIGYLALVLAAMAVVFTFIMIKIAPDYASIFQEFEIELPAMTELAIVMSDFVVRFFAAPIMLVAVLGAVGAIVVGILCLCDIRPSWLSDRLFAGRRNADVLRILALATDNRQPLVDVLYRMSRVYPSERIRRRMSSVVATVTDGGDWRDALLAARIVTKGEHGLIHTAEKVGNLSWALREAANRREKRAMYRLAMVMQVLYPVAILLLGAFIGFFVVSLFIPVVKVTQSLAC